MTRTFPVVVTAVVSPSEMTEKHANATATVRAKVEALVEALFVRIIVGLLLSEMTWRCDRVALVNVSTLHYR
jgi:hypothetical protein